MNTLELLKEQSASDGSLSNSNLNSTTNKEENLEQVNQQIGNTPIVARKAEKGWFGTVGKYKTTKDYKTYEELEHDVENKLINWQDVAIVVSAQTDYMQTLIEGLAKEIENLKN